MNSDKSLELIGPFNQNGARVLAKSYNGCQCCCHKQEGVMHFSPCCSSNLGEELRPRLQDEIDFSVLKLKIALKSGTTNTD